MRKENEEKYIRAIELKKQGISRKDIAEELGVNVRTITIWTKHIPRVIQLKSREDKLKTKREWYKKNNKTEKERINKNNKIRINRIRKWVSDYKFEKGCCKCPENDPVALDFHHEDETKKEGNIGTIIGLWSEKRIQKEIDKCVVICANCHRKLHYNYNNALISPLATNQLKG